MKKRITKEDATLLFFHAQGTVERVATWLTDLVTRGAITEAVARMSRLRPRDQAEIVAQLTPELQGKLLEQLTPENLGEIMGELETTEAVELALAMLPEQRSQVLDRASPNVAADVLRGLPADIATSAIENMEGASDVVPLLEYKDDAAGGLMTPELIALRDSMTVSQAMSFVRRWAKELHTEDISYLFVVDSNQMLKGGISLAQLVLAQPYQLINLLMDTDVISVLVDTDQEQCARLMERYDIHTLPVVDDDEKLVGVLILEDMIDVVEDEATEDMYRMIGVDRSEIAHGPFWRSVRNRLPWLCVNLGTAILAGLIITLFQSTLSMAIALAAFLPVIAGQGGIAGTQTLTLIVRSLALSEISPRSAKRLLLKEAGLGLVHGAVLGVLVGGIVLGWKGNEYLALVVGLAMMANLIVAGISGVFVPLSLRALRVDPALASAVAVTTITDVVGFLIYLGLATLAIGLITGG